MFSIFYNFSTDRPPWEQSPLLYTSFVGSQQMLTSCQHQLQPGSTSAQDAHMHMQLQTLK